MLKSAYDSGHPLQLTTIGPDLAKNVFEIQGIAREAEVAFNHPLMRAASAFLREAYALFDRYGVLQQRPLLRTRTDSFEPRCAGAAAADNSGRWCLDGIGDHRRHR